MFPASETRASAPGRGLCRDLASQGDSNQANNTNISVPSPSPPPSQLPSPFSNQVLSSSRSLTPPLIEPDSPHFALISRIFPDSPPPSIRSFSPPSYSPISSPEEPPRPTSPVNSTTSSVEFIDEIPIPLPQPRHYDYYDPDQSLDNLILQFPQRNTPHPPSSYSIGSDDFDLFEIRSTISGQNSDTIILVFLPISSFPYVLVRFFYNFFPPSTVIIREID